MHANQLNVNATGYLFISLFQSSKKNAPTFSRQCSMPTMPAMKPHVPSNVAPVSNTRRLGVTNNLLAQLEYTSK